MRDTIRRLAHILYLPSRPLRVFKILFMRDDAFIAEMMLHITRCRRFLRRRTALPDVDATVILRTLLHWRFSSRRRHDTYLAGAYATLRYHGKRCRSFSV